MSEQLRCSESKLHSEVSVLRTQCDDYRRRCERVETERNQLERDRAHYVTEVHVCITRVISIVLLKCVIIQTWIALKMSFIDN